MIGLDVAIAVLVGGVAAIVVEHLVLGVSRWLRGITRMGVWIERSGVDEIEKR